MSQLPSGTSGKDESGQFTTFRLILRESWLIWIPVIPILLGFGIFQVQIVKITIPPEGIWYLLLSLLLLWTIIAIIRLYIRIFAVEKKLTQAHREIVLLEKQAAPSFVLEDIVLSGLAAHTDLRKRKRNFNPVKLDMLSLDCKITGQGMLRDANVIYHIKGTNMADNPLAGIHLPIAGDKLVPFKDLHAKLYNLHSPTGRNSFQVPRLDGPDSECKELFLPFLNPGVEKWGAFDIELQYMWPGVFTSGKDYWFLDNLDYEGVTKQITITLEFIDVAPNSVRSYSINTISKISTFEGDVPPDPNNARRFVFEKANPDRDTYYVVLFEAP